MSLDAAVDYIALSDCWGKEPQFCTTSSNLSAMCNNILLMALPRTFQEAVQVRRRIGKRYLVGHALRAEFPF